MFRLLRNPQSCVFDQDFLYQTPTHENTAPSCVTTDFRKIPPQDSRMSDVPNLSLLCIGWVHPVCARFTPTSVDTQDGVQTINHEQHLHSQEWRGIPVNMADENIGK